MNPFDLVNSKAASTIAAIRRYRVVAQCDTCKYAEECVVDFEPFALAPALQFGLGDYSRYTDRAKTNEENLKTYYDDFYKGIGIEAHRGGHPHPVEVRVYQIDKSMRLKSLSRITYPAFTKQL